MLHVMLKLSEYVIQVYIFQMYSPSNFGVCLDLKHCSGHRAVSIWALLPEMTSPAVTSGHVTEVSLQSMTPNLFNEVSEQTLYK